MSICVVHSRSLAGVQALPVQVEAHLGGGLPALSIVGMPETTVKEARDRVRAAIINSGFDFPQRRITVNMAPADLPKSGGRFDLPIALGILAASGQIAVDAFEQTEFVGELALGGELREVAGVLPTSVSVKQSNRALVVPGANASEAGLVEDACLYAFDSLLQLCNALATAQGMDSHRIASVNCPVPQVLSGYQDMADVRGQHRARRALEIAAAGSHNLLMVGPPGTGKSMLASRLPGILPPMTTEQAMQSATVASISSAGFELESWRRRPFRAPHHTASGVALVGGGSTPMPGEISLAHNGVLFLDELPEFPRHVLDVMREPLENGSITISRAGRQAEFPALVQLVGAMNPCPCGYDGDEKQPCRCSPEQIARYRSRVSGPLLDRIDLHIAVQRVEYADLRADSPPGEASREVRQRVLQAHQWQMQRCGKPNAQMSSSEVAACCELDEQQHLWLEAALEKFALSARAIHRILKVARTIADLAGSEQIGSGHLAESVSYRPVPVIRPAATNRL